VPIIGLTGFSVFVSSLAAIPFGFDGAAGPVGNEIVRLGSSLTDFTLVAAGKYEIMFDVYLEDISEGIQVGGQLQLSVDDPQGGGFVVVNDSVAGKGLPLAGPIHGIHVLETFNANATIQVINTTNNTLTLSGSVGGPLPVVNKLNIRRLM
jgi:hypothetical protein